MEPQDTTPANGRGGRDVHLVSSVSLDRIRNPLSVAYGYVQLLQRRIRRGHVNDNHELLRNLEQTEVALRAIEMQLRELTEDKDRRP